MEKDPPDVTILDQCRTLYEDRGFFVVQHDRRESRGTCLRAGVSPQVGRGWMDIRELRDGISLGRCDCVIHSPHEYSYPNFSCNLGFNMLLCGGFQLGIPELGLSEQVQAGDLWLCSGRVEEVRYRHQPHTTMRGLSLDIPVHVLDQWREQLPQRFSRNLDALLSRDPAVCMRLTHHRPTISRLATRLLAQSCSDVCDELRLESQALDILAVFLGLDISAEETRRHCGGSRRSVAIDEAVDILCSEWVDPPTIAALARRVALNECYLKTGFRQRLGMTIGEYVRKLRMQKALELLETGEHSVLEVALMVGYSCPGHFSGAFRQFHGRLPSNCIR